MPYLGDDNKWYYNIVKVEEIDDETVKIKVEAVIGPFETEDAADNDESAIA